MKFLSFTFKDPNLAENLTNLAEIVGPRMVYGVAFSNSKDPWSLVGPGCHQVSRGVVVRIVEGKSRVKALLNTGLQVIIIITSVLCQLNQPTRQSRPQ